MIRGGVLLSRRATPGLKRWAGDWQTTKGLLLKDYRLSEAEQKLAKTEKMQGLTITSRGSGGKNEERSVKFVVDGCLKLNKERQTGGHKMAISGPIKLTGKPHLGEMMTALLRDIFLRMEMLRGNSVSNKLCKVW